MPRIGLRPQRSFNNETETQIVTQSRFDYDNRGRVTEVLDKNGGLSRRTTTISRAG